MKRTIGKRDAFIEVQKANYDLCEYADRCAKEGKDGFPIDYDSLPESIKSKDPKVERIERALCENANSQYKVSSKKYVS